MVWPISSTRFTKAATRMSGVSPGPRSAHVVTIWDDIATISLLARLISKWISAYLPGDIQSKIGPYMQPLYDNLAVIRNQFSEQSEMSQVLGRLIDDKTLIIEPLAYIRGRSLVKMFMIDDEAQNLTPHEVKTIITRAGEQTKVVFTGDIHQIDHPYLDSQSNGLSYLIEKMQGQPLYAHINLEKGERSELAMLASELL